MLGISYEQATDIAQKVAEGQEAIKPGWVRLDTNFIFSKFELEYIVKAIELVTLHAEKLLGFYVQEPSGQWSVNIGAHNPSYFFGMSGVLQSPSETSEYDLEERKGLFKAQLEQAMNILEDPHKFLYQLKQSGLVDVRNRVKQMFNQRVNQETDSVKFPHFHKSSDLTLNNYSANILASLDFENFENGQLKGKLPVKYFYLTKITKKKY